MFPSVDPVSVDQASLQATESESDFVGLGVDFLIEAASYLTIACSVYPNENGWSLEQAIIGGNGVRLHKLTQGFLDQTCQHRRELSEILSRLIFETSVNIIYLVKNSDGDLFKSYIDYSLKFERKLLAQIDTRKSARGGVLLPIEMRMIESINRLASSTGVSLDSPPINKRNWGDKDLFQKAEDIGWADAYVGAFAGTSTAVHGNWGDIASHHLERFDGSGFFRPCFEWSMPRPQHPFALAKMILVVSENIAEYIGGPEFRDYLNPLILNVFERIDFAVELHEEFLARAASTA